MRLLLIDTCGTEGSVALADTALTPTLVAEEVLPGRSASERLVPVVRTAMTAQGWGLGGLAAIVVMHGPGSFTGVRVGLSAAKGLSEASGVPLVAISRLAVLSGGDGCAVLDAGRGEFYFGEYRSGECAREALMSGEELVAAADGRMVVVCEAKVAEALLGLVPVQTMREPVAGDAVGIALARLAAGATNDAVLLDANYLRRTDAQLFAWAKPAVE